MNFKIKCLNKLDSFVGLLQERLHEISAKVSTRHNSNNQDVHDNQDFISAPQNPPVRLTLEQGRKDTLDSNPRYGDNGQGGARKRPGLSGSSHSPPNPDLVSREALSRALGLSLKQLGRNSSDELKDRKDEIYQYNLSNETHKVGGPIKSSWNGD